MVQDKLDTHLPKHLTLFLLLFNKVGKITLNADISILLMHLHLQWKHTLKVHLV